MNRPKIFCLLQLPPPVHGVSQINAYIVSHPVILDRFDLLVTELNFSKSVSDVRSFRFAKFFTLFKVIGKQIVLLFKHKPLIAYFTFNPTGVAFYRDLILLVILKLFGVKNIYLHLHGKGVDREIRKRPWLKALYKLAFKKTQVILISPLLYSDIAHVVKMNQVHYLPNAVPSTISSEELSTAIEHRKTRDIPCIVFLSNMILAKGPIELLKAISILVSNNLRFKAVFSGAWFHDGCREQFYSYVEAENLSHCVEYIGPTYGIDKKQLLLNGDIFVFPTYNDIFGIVNLEAMEAGLPVVSTYEGAIPEIIADGYTGYLVPKQDAVALADRLSILISTPELRREMGLNGRQRLKDLFDFDRYVVSLADILLGVHAKYGQ